MKNHDLNKWTDALSRHTSAVNAYVATAQMIDREAWFAPMAAGKWAPAQVTEHLNRSYKVVLDQLRGGRGIRVRSPWLLRQILRATVLRSIFRNRRLPSGAQAPSEVMPREVAGSQALALDRFVHLAREFSEEIASHRGDGSRITHHVFGAVELLPGIDFVAIHIEHHHRQISANAQAQGLS